MIFDISRFRSPRGERRALCSRVALAGRLDWREWETANGDRLQAISIVADAVQFLDPPAEAVRSEDEDDDALDEDNPATDD